MLRVIVFLYGLFAYATFLGVFLYCIGFVGNLLVPTSLDGAPVSPLGKALLINAALLTIFALQHSIMARQWFKKLWTKIVPEPIERSTYVLFTNIALAALVWYWQPIGGVVWSVESQLFQTVLWALFAFGWLLVLLSTFMIDHFDLFGMRQVTLYLMKKPYTPLEFKIPWLYKYVRHPLYIGFLFAFWATPTMTMSHLLFAVATTAYILVAVRIEEGDLVKAFGAKYTDYRRRVPMFIPGLGRSGPSQVADAEVDRTTT